MKCFYRLFLIFVWLICASTAGAANVGWRYQFDDVTGFPSGSGVGAQWVALTTSRDFSHNTTEHSIGAAATTRMRVETDLVVWNHPLVVVSDETRDYKLHSAFVVIPEGVGTVPVNFKWTNMSSSDELVTLAVYAAGFEGAYRVEGNPTPPFPQDSDVDVDVSFTKISGNEKYNSEAGELVFHQNPTSIPSQTLHIPFVVASVRDGDATGDLLDIKSTTRTTASGDQSGDIVARRWFKWDAKANKVEPAYADDWIFVPLDDRNPDNNILSADYNFTTEVTNHSGLRYGVQRYDDDRALPPDHWKFDVQPINPSLRMSLPEKFQLAPLSHIAPGLVTVYSHSAKVMTRQQNLLRIAAVDPTGQLLASKALQLNYRTIIGYSLGVEGDFHYALNAFEAYPSRTDFFKNALKAMDISSTSWEFPETNVVEGNVSFKQITADAISSFAMSAPVPWMGDGVSGDISPAMLGLHVVLRVPRARVEQHWDNFAKSRTLAVDFAEKYRVWFRSPNGADLDVTKFLKEEGKYDRTVKVFLDEENEILTVHYVLLTIEESNNDRPKRPRVRMVSDATLVNDYDYIVVDDGKNDGFWEMAFYVAPEVIIPPKDEESGGGCAAGLSFLSVLLVLPIVSRSAKRVLFVLLFLAVAGTASGATFTVRFNNDLPDTRNGSLRWAINQANNGGGIILFDGIDVMFLDPSLGPLPILDSGDVEIYGNGAKLDAGGNMRLFEVDGANVLFNALTFANGVVSDDGGAVRLTNGNANFELCTFDNNAGDNGGAVYVENGDASFTNCTFFQNSAETDGGAVAGGANSKLTFSFVTMFGNTALGMGQAVNAQGADNSFIASLFVGNGVGEQEITTSGASISFGYNVFADAFINATTGTDDFFNATPDDILNEPIIPARNDAAPRLKNWTFTLSLINNSNNPALGRVPQSIVAREGVPIDQRTVERCIGSVPSSSGAFEIFDPSAPVDSLQIGGLPNGIATVGFTALLSVRVNPSGANPSVSWTTSNVDAVGVTAFGKVFSIGKGNAVLTVTTTGYDVDGRRKTQQIPVVVKYGAEENPNYDRPDPNVNPPDPDPKPDEEKGGGGCNAGFAVIPMIFLYSLYRLFLGRRKGMKNKFLTILILLGTIFAGAQIAQALSVKLNTQLVQIVPQQPFFALIATATPTEDVDKYEWSVSDDQIVYFVDKIDETAKIRGLKAGQTTVFCKVTSSDTSVFGTASCDVVVFGTGMTSVSLLPPKITLALNANPAGKTSPDFQPFGATPIGFTWSTNNAGVATVDASGNITAAAKGTATITYSALAVPMGGGIPISFDAKCDVTVLQALTSINITPTLHEVTVGSTKDIIVTYLPPDADSVDVDWTIAPADTKVATITPLTPTSATFYAASFPAPNPTPGKNPVIVTAKSKFWPLVQVTSCDVIIHPIPVTGVTMTPQQIVTARNVGVQITATPVPPDATKASETMTSSNTVVATVAGGIVTGKNQGISTITYTFKGWAINANKTHSENLFSATSRVTVSADEPKTRVSGITVSPTTLTLRRGVSYQLFPTIIPHNADMKTVFWSSDNPIVATVSNLGVVSAHAEGTATISVITADLGVGGTITPAKCVVTVESGGEEPNDPAYLPKDEAVKQQLEDMNRPLLSAGVEVGFGFELERPSETSLVDYGALPMFLPKLDASSNVKIGLAERANPDKFETVGSAGKFEINVAELRSYGWTAVVPVSLKLTLTDAMLEKYLPSGTSVSAVLANPRPYLGALFTAFSLQKQIIDVGSANLNKFVPLFSSPQAALLAVNDGVLFVKTLGNKLEITLNYFVADSENTTANYIENNLIIGDGADNGIIRDPVWILAPTQGGGGGGSGSGGGGGCNAASGFGLFALIAGLFAVVVNSRSSVFQFGVTKNSSCS